MNIMDSTSLKALLSSWGLLELLPVFLDENIGIEELKMMKNHHVVELLHSYKLGTRIRFEYYLERWRRDQNKPLLLDVVTSNHNHSTCSATAAHTVCLVHSPPQEAQKKLQSRATNTVTVHYATVATNTTDMMPKMPTKDVSPPTLAPFKDATTTSREMPKLTRQPSMLEEGMTAPNTLAATPSPNTTTMASLTAPTCPPRVAPRFQFGTNDSAEAEQVDTAPLLHILNSSGFKGNSLLEYYQQHKQLTNVHRTLLIQLIVNFFDLNEYHLSLKVSHSLEEQIVKLFPCEKIEYYRTEKRGKIYVKFCNMKRYKRDKPTLKRKWLEDVGAGEEGAGACVSGGPNMIMEPEVGIECGDEDMDDYAQSFEYWHAQQSPSGMQVKTESLSDGDY